MSRTIEVKVSDDSYERMKADAEKTGLSIAEYAGSRLEQHEAHARRKPTKEQVLEWIRELTPVGAEFDSADVVRAGRDERAEERRDPALLPHDEFMALLRRRELASLPLTATQIMREMRGPLPDADDDVH